MIHEALVDIRVCRCEYSLSQAAKAAPSYPGLQKNTCSSLMCWVCAQLLSFACCLSHRLRLLIYTIWFSIHPHFGRSMLPILVSQCSYVSQLSARPKTSCERATRTSIPGRACSKRTLIPWSLVLLVLFILFG